MNIRLDNYRITSDGICVSLFKTTIIQKGENKGKINDSVIGHYSSIIQALDRWLEEKIAESTAENIKELKKDIIEIKNIFNKIEK